MVFERLGYCDEALDFVKRLHLILNRFDFLITNHNSRIALVYDKTEYYCN